MKKEKESKNINNIKIWLNILFVLTLLSIYLASVSISYLIKFTNPHGFNFTKNYWVCWLWLPLPILSIVLGFKYTRIGIKCNKNIIGGFIMCFMLIMYGSFYFFPTYSEEYTKIENYKEIIKAELPATGELEIQDWGTYFDNDKTDYTIINAYYDNEDTSNLVSSIENSSYWILSTEIESVLKLFIPSTLISDTDAYYSIYNKTLNEYNSLPTISGNYEIYAMKYDKSIKQLEIHNFKYSYNKTH